MRRTLFTLVITGALIVMELSACTKEDVSPIHSIQPRSISRPFKMDLVADQWMTYGDGVYINNFHDVLSTLSMEARGHLSVYLTDYEGISVTRSPILLDGHEMWISMTTNDLILNYRYPYPPLPFNSLNVEVVVN